MSATERIRALGITLPQAATPGGAYVPAVRSGSLVFTAGQIPTVDGRLLATGHVGAEVAADEAPGLARQCAINALAAIDGLVGIDSVRQVVKVTGFVASAPGFAAQPSVIDGASRLLVEIFGAEGEHARSAVGVAELPGGAPVEVEIVVEVAS